MFLQKFKLDFFFCTERRMHFYVAVRALLIVFLSLFSRKKDHSFMLPSSDAIWGMSQKCLLLLEKSRGVAVIWYLISSRLCRKDCCSFSIERCFLWAKTHHKLISQPQSLYWWSNKATLVLGLVTFLVRHNCLRCMLKSKQPKTSSAISVSLQRMGKGEREFQRAQWMSNRSYWKHNSVVHVTGFPAWDFSADFSCSSMW